jgi:hypothetical protein
MTRNTSHQSEDFEYVRWDALGHENLAACVLGHNQGLEALSGRVECGSRFGCAAFFDYDIVQICHACRLPRDSADRFDGSSEVTLSTDWRSDVRNFTKEGIAGTARLTAWPAFPLEGCSRSTYIACADFPCACSSACVLNTAPHVWHLKVCAAWGFGCAVAPCCISASWVGNIAPHVSHLNSGICTGRSRDIVLTG